VSFPELLDAALAGTARRDPPAALPALESLAPESRLLRGAGYEGLRRLAGRAAPEGAETDPRPVPCPPETLPEVSPGAAARLREILARCPEHLAEWLGLCQASGRRLPAVLLPELLDYARGHPDVLDLLDLLPPVGGERLRWLAAQNPAWEFLAPGDPLATFETGRRDQRVRALRTLRRQDTARGRDLLAAAWDAESPDTRAALLASLAEGLSPEDEPLLQRAVGDARKDVREVGLRLIRHLPESRFRKRWAERAPQLIRFKKGFLGRVSLDVVEPTTFDPAWAADGVDQRPPRAVGRTAWWLQQIVSLTPPGIWPPAGLGAVQKNDWASALVPGLSQAATAYRDPAWCEALIGVWALNRESRHAAHIDVQRLVEAAPREQAEAALRRALDQDLAVGARLMAVARLPWSAALSGVVVRRLPGLLTTPGMTAAAAVGQAIISIHPSALAEAIGAVREAADAPGGRSLLGSVLRSLEFRQAMRREFE
jgi:hypothetical protein